jgi:PAS domain S-box-containing protein
MSQAKILLVDDDARVRRLISSMLAQRSDWEICGEASDGQESIEQARAKNPDVVLMDVSMPGMNGLDATRILRREIPQADVILVSQNDPRIVSLQASEVGARSYCSKSDLARNLLPIIERALEERHSKPPDMTSHRFDRGLGDQAANLLAAIVDSSDDVIISKTLDGIITSWNKSAERVFGYAAKEAIGSHISLIIPKDRYPEEDDILARVKRGESIDHFDTVRQRKDGSVLDISLTISPVRDSSGRVVGASKVAREITERKRAERNTALLAAIVDSSDDAIVSKTLDGIISSWNKSAEHMFGYRADEAIGKHITLIIPRERWDEESGIIQRLRRGERVDHFHTVRQRKDGSLIDVSLTISPVRDFSGHIIGASKVARDITDQVRAAEALRDSEEKFRTVIQTANDAVLVADADGRIVEFNPKATEIFGYTRQEIVGKPISTIMPERYRARYHQALDRYRATGESQLAGKTAEFDGLAKDGREFPPAGLPGQLDHEEQYVLHRRPPRHQRTQVGRAVVERKRRTLSPPFPIP